MSDPYVYPNTDILKNKFSIKEFEPLHKMESIYTGRRILELIKIPIVGNFDLNHLLRIHKYIFQDVYNWAGEIRTVDISKGNSFARHMVVGTYFEDSVTIPLKTEDYFKNIKNKDLFSRKLAYYFDHVNAAHPFREGNGRAQREFFRTLALKNGFKLDWTITSQEEMIDCSIKSLVKNDQTDLERLIFKCITNSTPDIDLINFYKKLTK